METDTATGRPADAAQAYIVPVPGLGRRRAPVGAWVISAAVVALLAIAAVYAMSRSQISWRASVSARRLADARSDAVVNIHGIRRADPER